MRPATALHPAFLATGLGLAILLSACSTAPQPSPTSAPMRVGVTDLTATLLEDLSQANPSAAPGAVLLPLPAARQDLAAGKLDFILTTDASATQPAVPLGYLEFVIVVNPANSIRHLSLTDIQGLLTGRMRNWSLAGGAPGAVSVISRADDADGYRAFCAVALAGGAPSLGALLAPNWEAMREAVSQDANAIGFLPVTELDESVARVDSGAELRVLIVAALTQEPTGRARQFLAWAQSEAGQQAVAIHYQPLK